MDMAERMIFVVGAPRSGTTLLMRMLNAHPDVYSRPEPHLLTPLARLGYFGRVQAAPYDVFQAQQAARSFVAELPGGESDLLDALRAYADTLYGRMLAPTNKRYFVDKTPAYALELPFITALYPRARYVVLTRHPFAIFSSYAQSFFDDDWAAAHAHNPLLERYLPALADFLRSSPVPHLHVRYEALVSDPEAHMQDLCHYTGLAPHPGMVDYGETRLEGAGLGDPIGVNAHTRPSTGSIDKWALTVKGRPDRVDLLHRMLSHVDDDDLKVLGFDRERLWIPVEKVSVAEAEAAQKKARRWDRYHLERRALLHLRRLARTTPLGLLLDRARTAGDVLLREGWNTDSDRGRP